MLQAPHEGCFLAAVMTGELSSILRRELWAHDLLNQTL